MNSRIKNYGLWVAIIAWVPMFLGSLEVYDINVILPDNFEKVALGLLGILVLAGVLSNPKEGTGFLDEKD